MVGTILFVILGVIAIAAALGMLTSENAVHAALFLVINLACVALFYLGLGAPFLAMVQITVYAGAIMVLFLFVIMLLGAERVPMSSHLRWQRPLAIVLVSVLVAATGIILFSPQVGVRLPTPPELGGVEARQFGSPASVGEVLFSRYLFPFELTSVLLLVAMIGAVVLVRDEKKPRGAAAKTEQQGEST